MPELLPQLTYTSTIRDSLIKSLLRAPALPTTYTPAGVYTQKRYDDEDLISGYLASGLTQF